MEVAAFEFLAARNVKPSSEQLEVVRAALDGNHVCVNSVAGSGKTTTVVVLGAFLLFEGKGRRVLLLTYNSELKKDTRKRRTRFGLNDVLEVHSFHAAGYRYFSSACEKDEGLRECVLNSHAVWEAEPPRWDFVVIDEAQDVDRLKFAFTLRLVRRSMAFHHAPPPQLLVIGDAMQAIYAYAGADVRFLSMAASHAVWTNPRSDPRPWVALRLSQTFRLTPAMAQFVSEVALRSPGYLVSSKTPKQADAGSWVRPCAVMVAADGCQLAASGASIMAASDNCQSAAMMEAVASAKVLYASSHGDASSRSHTLSRDCVEYLVGNPWVNAREAAKLIIEAVVLTKTLRADEVFVLAPSIKIAQVTAAGGSHDSPLAIINQMLAAKGVLVYIHCNEMGRPRAEDMVGKVAFSTFHSAKGRERRLVIVLGFDARYFEYYARGAAPSVCPNPIYVAMTRATQKLVLCCERYAGGELPFLAPRAGPATAAAWSSCVEIRGAHEDEGDKPAKPQPPEQVPVVDLLCQLPSTVLARAMGWLDFELVAPASLRCFVGTIALPDKVPTRSAVAAPAAPGAAGTDGGGAAAAAAATTFENVADVNGLALTSLLEVYVLRRPEPSIYEAVEQAVRRVRRKAHFRSLVLDWDAHLRRDRLAWGADTPPGPFLRLTAMYKVLVAPETAGLVSLYTQLGTLDWLERGSVELCLQRLRAEVPRLDMARVEVLHEAPVTLPHCPQGATLQGICDVEAGEGDVYELKCCAELSDTHKLQLACYAFLHATEQPAPAAEAAITHAEEEEEGGAAFCGAGGSGAHSTAEIVSSAAPVPKRFHLLNVLTGERWRLRTTDPARLQAAVDVLVDGKYGDKGLMDDADFLACTRRLQSLYVLTQSDLDAQSKPAPARGTRPTAAAPAPAAPAAAGTAAGGAAGGRVAQATPLHGSQAATDQRRPSAAPTAAKRLRVEGEEA